MYGGSNWGHCLLLSFPKRKCVILRCMCLDGCVCSCLCCWGPWPLPLGQPSPGISLFCTKSSHIFRELRHPDRSLWCNRQSFQKRVASLSIPDHPDHHGQEIGRCRFCHMDRIIPEADIQSGLYGSCAGWASREQSLIYRDDLTGKLLPGKGLQTGPFYLTETVIIIRF